MRMYAKAWKRNGLIYHAYEIKNMTNSFLGSLPPYSIDMPYDPQAQRNFPSLFLIPQLCAFDCPSLTSASSHTLASQLDPASARPSTGQSQERMECFIIGLSLVTTFTNVGWAKC